MVDENLFLYDLAVVAIMKNEDPYLKEWLDYHLLAGVQHFYLYDNESTDNQAEVAKPYVEAGLVDYIYFPGKVMQYPAYNDAVKKFKFQCRYMAFIDLDEFIFPKSNQSIVEVVDEILSRDKNAAGLAINWQLFGSNGEETADYSRGVLERFTRRAPKDWSDLCPQKYLAGNIHIKTIANPRTIHFINNPHYAHYFKGFFSVNENGNGVQGHDNNPVTVEKIVVNHYYTKSLEEFRIKQRRGRSDVGGHYDGSWYNFYNRNEEFDDGILKYRAARAEKFSLESDAQRFNRVTQALVETLSRTEFSLETALICRALSSYLREHFPDDKDYFCSCEEAALGAILKSLDNINRAEVQMFIRNLPNLLSLPYPAVKEVRYVALNLIKQMIYISRMEGDWATYVNLYYLQDFLRSD